MIPTQDYEVEVARISRSKRRNVDVEKLLKGILRTHRRNPVCKMSEEILINLVVEELKFRAICKLQKYGEFRPSKGG